VESEFKVCNSCGLPKPRDAFHRHRGGLYPTCKVCRRLRATNSDAERATLAEFNGAERALSALLGRSWARRLVRAGKE
jgi:hypothetical protein